MRCEFVYLVMAPIGPGGALLPIPNVAITPWEVNPDGTEGNQAVAYAARTGVTPANMVTDAGGEVSAWFEPGDYNIHFDDEQTPARIASFQVGFSSVPWANSNGTSGSPPSGPAQNSTFGGATGTFGGSGLFGT